MTPIPARWLTWDGSIAPGRILFRFEYSPEWLAHPLAFSLDPELTLAEGSFYPKDSNFGIFMDSCPDRWGQILMKRRELVEAKQEGRAKRELTNWDFFLGVQDITRMGALRFSPLQSERQLKKGERPLFTATACLANEALSAPALSHLSELQNVALELTRKKVNDLNLLHQWLRVLVALGLPGRRSTQSQSPGWPGPVVDCQISGRRR